MKRRRKSRAPRKLAGEPIGVSGGPVEGADAGPDDDLCAQYLRQQIRERRGRAKRRFENARRFVGEGRDIAEPEARAAIDAAVRAFWWAEGTDDEDALHDLMHTIGRWTRTHCGCRLHYDGQRYSHRCPIVIAHKRFGFSAGYTGNLICSICGDDLSECPHIRGRSYWVRGGAQAGRRCAVCLGQTCDHRDDRLYRASVVSINTKLQAQEVSFVGRPADPEARLLEVPVEIADLQATLGPAFQAGVEVNCDLCLGPGWGFTEMPDEEPVRRSQS